MATIHIRFTLGRTFLVLAIFSLCSIPKLVAQEAEGYVIPYIVEDGEKWFLLDIPESTVKAKASKKQQRAWREYYKMVYNLKRVYPYSQIAKRKLLEMNNHFLNLKTEKERKAYVKQIEKEMMAEFEAPLRKLTRSQGIMLIKLVDRETGQSSFDIVKELKGGVTAFFWQNMARLFGSNLKSRYDMHGEDKVLEELVVMCENGTFEALYYSMFSR